jgi:drug/metabolite transporter (DMT)-like permease
MGDNKMDTLKIVAILLIVAGALALGYGGFSYTSETHTADLGSLHMSVSEKERVNVPVWAGIGAILLGGFLFVAGKKS